MCSVALSNALPMRQPVARSGRGSMSCLSHAKSYLSRHQTALSLLAAMLLMLSMIGCGLRPAMIPNLTIPHRISQKCTVPVEMRQPDGSLEAWIEVQPGWVIVSPEWIKDAAQ